MMRATGMAIESCWAMYIPADWFFIIMIVAVREVTNKSRGYK